MAIQRRTSELKRAREDSGRTVQGVFGVILSVLGLLLAFQAGTDNLLLFILFLLMVIGGIVLVAKALGD